MPKSRRVARHQTEDPKRIGLAIEVGEMPAAGASQKSRSDSWKRRRRSAPELDKGRWTPRVPRAGSHPTQASLVAVLDDRLGPGRAVPKARLSDREGS